MTDYAENKSHWMYAIMLGIVGLLIIAVFVLIRTRADETPTSGVVENTAPVISDVVISESAVPSAVTTVTPDENTVKEVWVSGTLTDANGCQNLGDGADVAGTPNTALMNFAVAYAPDAAIAGCASGNPGDNDNCYNFNSYIDLTNGVTDLNRNNLLATDAAGYATCTFGVLNGDDCSGPTDTTVSFNCKLNVAHYATVGAWTAKVLAFDSDNGAATAATDDTTEIGSFRALSLAGDADFDSLGLGATSADPVAITVTNTGNTIEDLSIKNTIMTCTNLTVASGTIPAANISASLAANFADPSALSAADEGVPFAAFDLAKSSATGNDIDLSTKPVYLKLTVPATGVAGACSGTMTFISNANGA